MSRSHGRHRARRSPSSLSGRVARIGVAAALSGVSVLGSLAALSSPASAATAGPEITPLAAGPAISAPAVSPVMTAAVAPAVVQTALPSRRSGRSLNWDRVARCESGGNWSISTGNGYYGGLQFKPSTWRAFGGKGMPHKASKAEQIRVAERVLDAQGPGAWPVCSKRG